MSDKNAEEICERFYTHLNTDFTNESDPFEMAQKLRETNWQMFQECAKMGYSSNDSSTILLDGLEKYRQLCRQTNAENINNYTRDGSILIKSLPAVPNFDDFNTNLCDSDQFLQKYNDENKVNRANISSEDIRIFFTGQSNENTELFNEIIPATPTFNNSQKSLNKSKFTLKQPSEKLRKITERNANEAAVQRPANVFDPLIYKRHQSPKNTVKHTTNTVPEKRPSNLTIEDIPTKIQPNNIRDVASSASSMNFAANSFKTGREELFIQNLKKNATSSSSTAEPLFSYGSSKKSLGGRRNVFSKFIPPIAQQSNEENTTVESDDVIDERLKNIDPKMIELIRGEIIENLAIVDWNDIAGLDYAKTIIKEAVVWPLLRPDIFTGLRRPPRGILLFGPPGTGKTLIGRCIATQSKSTFFCITASSITSKWIGEGEKMVRALFAVAACHQPAVVFIDEIDSLLSQRSDVEHESSRRLKTEFLIQLDGAATNEDERILIVGATNRPQELDEAARRRLTKRLYIPLPDLKARIQILKNLLKSNHNQMTIEQLEEIGQLTDGFSGADMKTLCHEALMGPIRSISMEEMSSINANNIRPVNFNDFVDALKHVRPSVSPDDLTSYIKWDKIYGSGGDR